MSKTEIVTRKPVRLSYVHLTKPRTDADGNNPKYSATLLIPKKDTDTVKLINDAVNAAREAAAARGIRNGKNLKSPLHDGDGQKPNGGDYGPECNGMWVLNASAKADRRPGIVDRHLQPILDETEIYSGMWANVAIGFFAYSVSGNSGIACGLNHVQKVRDDDALDGRKRAEDVFAELEDEEEDLGL